MATKKNKHRSFKTRAFGEFNEFLVLSAYLYVAFSALVLFKAGVLREVGNQWSPWGFAAVKALLVAKFMLVGRAAQAGERLADKPLIWRTVYRSLIFLVVVLVLTVIEEAVV